MRTTILAVAAVLMACGGVDESGAAGSAEAACVWRDCRCNSDGLTLMLQCCNQEGVWVDERFPVYPQDFCGAPEWKGPQTPGQCCPLTTPE